jgi:hypothetical protein
VTDPDSREAVRLEEEGVQRRKVIARNRRQRELYGPKHRRRRRQFAQRIERGEEILCPRCKSPIGPDQLWDLGHDDYNPAIERPEHRECNRAAPNRLQTSREW